MDLKRVVAALACLSALAGCNSGSPGDRIVARAGTHEFTVQDVVDLLSGAQYPNEGEVIGALANFCATLISSRCFAPNSSGK